jgi:hypothetical protein
MAWGDLLGGPEGDDLVVVVIVASVGNAAVVAARPAYASVVADDKDDRDAEVGDAVDLAGMASSGVVSGLWRTRGPGVDGTHQLATLHLRSAVRETTVGMATNQDSAGVALVGLV